MKHQYTYTLFFDVNKTVYEFFSVSHLTEEMVKCYTIQCSSANKLLMTKRISQNSYKYFNNVFFYFT